MAQAHSNTAARAAIKAAGLRHADVAAQLGIDASKLSKSLSGVRQFTAVELEKLAEVTGVTVDSLRPLSTENSAPLAHPRQAEWAERRRAIAAVAWPLFTTNGYQAVKIADIAREAGISSSAVHYYFHSKNDIFLATLDLCSEQAAGRRDQVTQISDPALRLLRFAEIQLDGSTEATREWTTWAQFWASAPTFPDARRATAVAYSRWQEQLRAIVLEGMASGQFCTADPDEMINAVTAMIDGLGVRMLAGTLSPVDAAHAATAYLKTWFTTAPASGSAVTVKENA
ncbi:TetR family transcriptional regulator C-terminal domain-containing protein [uncultured Corynebacterium sp.]|uniref:TetR family transcriptional regulator C-terminal domain-containing protein n=1 Tax=uncultured Corynebacterium sp. TaxID=159447 RepID=UPI002636F08F|nr:TetR family transcriptional regulator C-terminal domain-containing protein [uncultured Corynebacterium sp.]